ncbi:CAP domain-containing protein [Antarctobacter sp.]|uniref:CAP domain-containing protein n=1 Tax=Antarctobacter sp. TaxID=1872577 RepID=UPI003A943550
MNRRAFLAMSSAVAMAACTTTPIDSEPRMGPDGKPLPKVYRISAGQTGRIQYRMLDSVNALRKSAGVPELELDSKLTAAAATHARDMSVQNRPWLFGSDGSSPIDRMNRVGYSGRYIGEAISESYETELETLAAWMEREDTRRIILDGSARDLGFSWFQEPNGKIWWDLVLGEPGKAGPVLSQTPPPAS